MEKDPVAHVRTSLWALPEDAPLVRNPPRPLELREPDYMDRFDSRTVLYDAFLDGDRVVLVGPPPRNLKRHLRDSRWTIDGVEVEPTIFARRKAMDSYAPVPPDVTSPSTLRVEGRLGDVELTIQPSGLDLFENRRVVFTLSKNNDLAWIRQWANFYVQQHGADAVLLYDNGSTEYTTEDLRRTLGSVPGLETVVVVDWDHPYGPQGFGNGLWESFYLQRNTMVHARGRFLARAQGVLNSDIDELVLTADGDSVFSHAERSAEAVVLFGGRWIENDVPQGAYFAETPTFRDFGRYDPEGADAFPKWCLDPRRLPDEAAWGTHGVHPITDQPTTDAVLMRHFRGISTHWKYERNARDSAGLVVDRELRGVMDAIDWDRTR